MSHSLEETHLTALAEWWEEMGVEVDRSALKQAAPAKTLKAHQEPAAAPAPVATRSSLGKLGSLEARVAAAQSLAANAQTLDALKEAIEGYEGCPLKAGANKTVVFDGVQGAPVMVIGEGAGGTEDQVGLPFVGKAGKLLDRMLASIGLSRETNTFITNVTYWRPPGNRNPEADELAVCRPFVDRMVELGAPKLIISAGGVSAKSLLETKTGIMRLRGKPVQYITPGGVSAPLVPIFHPAYLLRRPQDKSRAWRDLLLIQKLLAADGAFSSH
ncbi:MAG: uracil-DNA glycosylase [Pseudomonadota bacterium]